METRETITLDARTQQRLLVLTHVLAGELTIDAAAAYPRLSPRQVHRLADRLRVEGAAGLVHGNRGRPPVNRVDDAVRAAIIDQALTTYAGFNPVHLAETLAETDPAIPSARTVQRILGDAGIPTPRTRHPPRHRSRRDRMPRPGMLVQADGSRHDWLEDRGPRLTLVSAIDDATGILTGATFRDQEDAVGYFTVLGQAIERYGLPEALYTDLAGILIKDPNRPPTLAEQLAGKRSFTQVGRALASAASAGSAPAVPRRRAGSSARTGRSRTASCPSCGGPASRPAPMPTSSSPGSCPATTAASPSSRQTRSRPGGRGRRGRHPGQSFASTTPAGWPPTRRSAGTARRSASPGATTAGRGPVGRSSSRSALTAACGSTAKGRRGRSLPRLPVPHSSAPGRSHASPSWPSHPSHGLPSSGRRRPRRSSDLELTIPGGSTLLSDHGDKVAVRLAVRIAVLRQCLLAWCMHTAS
jgi:hypothetical protein